MNKKSIIFLTSIAMFLCGCGLAPPVRQQPVEPTTEEKEKADYGLYPDNYEELIKEKMQTALKDPQSAQYRYESKPEKAYNIAYNKSELRYFYRVRVFINAKNSYGGYIGEHKYFFDIRDGSIIDYGDLTQALKDLEDYLKS